MLTPDFTLSQDENDFIISIEASHATLSSVRILVEENLFYFTADPGYQLELNIPGDVNQDLASIRVSVDGSKYIVKLEKDPPGESFPDLDFHSKLLFKPASQQKFAGIEVLNENGKTYKEDADINWTAEFYCTPKEDKDFDISLLTPKFGFALRYSLDNQVLQNNDLVLACDLKDARSVPESRRPILKRTAEMNKFSPEHYLADFEVNPPSYEVPWSKDPDGKPEFSKEARYRMQVLSCKALPCLDDIHLRKSVYLGCLDLMLAFTYDYIIREGDENPESGWNIAKLASSLSWLQIYHSIDEVLNSFIRRLLCYPIYRNWRFGKKIIKKVANLFLSQYAKEWLLWALLETRSSLIATPGFYLFANYYLDDYCVWIQTCADLTALNNLGQAIHKLKLSKSHLDEDFKLIQLETLLKDEAPEESRLEEDFCDLKIS